MVCMQGAAVSVTKYTATTKLRLYTYVYVEVRSDHEMLIRVYCIRDGRIYSGPEMYCANTMSPARYHTADLN